MWQEKCSRTPCLRRLLLWEGAARRRSQAALRCFQHKSFWRCEISRGKDCPRVLDSWTASYEQQAGFSSRLTPRVKYQFSQPGRAAQSTLIFPLLCTIGGWTGTSPLRQEDRHGRCCRLGTPTSSRGLVEEQPPCRIHVSAACAARGLGSLLHHKHFLRGEGECAQSLFN